MFFFYTRGLHKLFSSMLEGISARSINFKCSNLERRWKTRILSGPAACTSATSQTATLPHPFDLFVKDLARNLSQLRQKKNCHLLQSNNG